MANPIQTQMISPPAAGGSGAFIGPNAFTGAAFQNQQNAFNTMSQQAQMANNLNLKQGQREMEEWEKDDLLRQAKRGAGIAESKATEATIGRQKEADVSSKELANTKTRGTMDSDIASTNANNMRKAHAAAAQSLYEAAPGIEAAGPAWRAQAAETLKETKVPPQIAKMLQQATSPQQFNQIVTQYRDRVANDIQQQQANQQASHKGDIDAAKQELANKGHLDVANVGRASREELALLKNQIAAAEAAGDVKTMEHRHRILMDKRDAAVNAGDFEAAKKYHDLADETHVIIQHQKASGAAVQPSLGGLQGTRPSGTQPQQMPKMGAPAAGPVRNFVRGKDGKLIEAK